MDRFQQLSPPHPRPPVQPPSLGAQQQLQPPEAAEAANTAAPAPGAPPSQPEAEEAANTAARLDRQPPPDPTFSQEAAAAAASFLAEQAVAAPAAEAAAPAAAAAPTAAARTPPFPPSRSSQYDVREVRDHREHSGKRFYLVDWQPSWMEEAAMTTTARAGYWAQRGMHGDEDAGCPARRSSDTAAPNSHGRQLLSLCQSSAARICNGRVPGTTSGDATSFGSRGSGRAVVDYWLASASLLPRLPTMAVDSWGLAAQHSDHATLLLELAAPPAVQRDSTAQQEHTSAPPQQRQFELGTAEQLAAAVALLAGTQRQLDALAAAAESAASPAALEQLAAAFAELMVETLDGAGMRQRSSNGGAQRPHSLPRSLQRQYGIRDARRAQRNAVQQAAVAQQRGIGPEQQDAALRREVGRCRNRLKRRLVAAWHKCQALRGEKLEQLAKTDPQDFFFRLKPQAAKQLNLVPEDRETYLDAVRRRQDREALAQLRTGSHWGAEETGRWTRRPREQRVCPHCHDGIEDAPHMLLTCPLYAPLRLNFPDLFAEPHPPHRFLRQKPCRLAAFAAACHQRWLTATVALPAVPP
ncbi:hypothetical protein CHLNCDRAFT_56640 [Chlorella variabilis]|uniref:Endonuclease/exonuclease/phosphatase domain-containing protein n=1 Tax=Chlorella variabilis TaxID=554065 RepID=E1Z3M4_CHLVA|nr:hypothetical protein CHLNCDRAFT_56640 [Chlorella variabilis]EFN60189.1 hypothetical protein CHLNCDRAFT_56640 [Chlorella variabilis]|eukprot:XP_005852291.1 hypothetical protein CHLNCDRAFT_56640 [Chlorella variabilis]